MKASFEELSLPLEWKANRIKMYFSDTAQLIPSWAPFQTGLFSGIGGTAGSTEQEGEKPSLVLILKFYQDVPIFCHSIYYLAKHNIFLLFFQMYAQIHMKNQVLSRSKAQEATLISISWASCLNSSGSRETTCTLNSPSRIQSCSIFNSYSPATTVSTCLE